MLNSPIDGESAPTSGGDDGELTLLRIANILLANRWLVIILTVGLGALVGIKTFLSDRKFSAISIIAPESSGPKTSQVSSLAAQFGVSVPSGSAGTESAQFYQKLLTSEEVLLALANTNYTLPTDQKSGKKTTGTLYDLYEIGGPPNQRDWAMMLTLAAAVFVTPDDTDNTVTVKTTAKSPQLALAMNHRLLQIADEFNGDRRRSRAGSERLFLESRVAEARRDLDLAERRVQEFQTSNRTFQSSPSLNLEMARLQRNLVLQQEIYVGLQKSYEQARIDEVRNTPVLTVVSKGLVQRPQPRGTIVKTLLAMMVGFVIAAVIAFARTSMEFKRLNREGEYERFVALRAAALRDIRRVIPGGSRKRPLQHAGGAR